MGAAGTSCRPTPAAAAPPTARCPRQPPQRLPCRPLGRLRSSMRRERRREHTGAAGEGVQLPVAPVAMPLGGLVRLPEWEGRACPWVVGRQFGPGKPRGPAAWALKRAGNARLGGRQGPGGTRPREADHRWGLPEHNRTSGLAEEGCPLQPAAGNVLSRRRPNVGGSRACFLL